MKAFCALLFALCLAAVYAGEPLLNTQPDAVLPLHKHTHLVNPSMYLANDFKSIRHSTVRPIVTRPPPVPSPAARVGDDPVEGDIFPVAIFWVEIGVGTPPSLFPVAIDSGSSTTDIPDINCPTCVKVAPNNVYNGSASSTSSPVSCDNCFFSCTNNQCSFSNSYQTCDLSDPTAACTIDGLLWTDNMAIGPVGPTNFGFGTITYQTSNFDQFKYIDGVMGMAGGADDGCLFAALFNAGFIKQNVWGVCIHEGKTSNGTLTIGGVDTRLYTGDIKYVSNQGFGGYGMNTDNITVFGQAVSGSNSNAILDSGTNILLIPDQMFTSLRSIFESQCSSKPLPGICGVTSGNSLFDGKCYNFTAEQIAEFPPIVINLTGGVPLTMKPVDYLIREHTQNFICLGILDTGADGFFIIGDTTMQEYFTVFDNANNQIGFAPVNTDNCGSL